MLHFIYISFCSQSRVFANPVGRKPRPPRSTSQLNTFLSNSRRGQRDTAVWNVRGFSLHHFDAIQNRADAEAKGASCAIVLDGWQVRFRVKGDRLVTGIVADHVALACKQYVA